MLAFENAAVTVTVVALASSATLDGSTDRLIAGAPSSSVRVIEVPFTVSFPAVPSAEIVSLPSIRVSSTGVSMKGALPLLAPAATVTVKAFTGV